MTMEAKEMGKMVRGNPACHRKTSVHASHVRFLC
jgi:hypothetical protein